MDNPRLIVLKGDGIQKERAVRAANTVTPGMLLSLHTDGTVFPHGAAGAAAQRAFAVENGLAGKGPATSYAAGERCFYTVLPRGAEVAAKLGVDAAAIVIGDALESAGDGTVRKVVPQADTDGIGAPVIRTDKVVGYALEAVDNSGAGAITHILMEVA